MFANQSCNQNWNIHYIRGVVDKEITLYLHCGSYETVYTMGVLWVWYLNELKKLILFFNLFRFFWSLYWFVFMVYFLLVCFVDVNISNALLIFFKILYFNFAYIAWIDCVSQRLPPPLLKWKMSNTVYVVIILCKRSITKSGCSHYYNGNLNILFNSSYIWRVNTKTHTWFTNIACFQWRGTSYFVGVNCLSLSSSLYMLSLINILVILKRIFTL